MHVPMASSFQHSTQRFLYTESQGVLLLPAGCDASPLQAAHQHYHLGGGHVGIKSLTKHHTTTLAAA